jgi:tRNA pseudouridine55 synthase
MNLNEGILLVDKPKGKTSFSLVSALRKKTGIQKIGHAGTLDPFATGLMIMLIGKQFTRLSDQYLTQDKEYQCTVRLGITTDTYDCEGIITETSPIEPSLSDIEHALIQFNGTMSQIPPMFSAKKIKGQKLYELARRGISIERQPVSVTLKTTLISYNYPNLELHIACSKGTYIRSLAYDLGRLLGCGAHLNELRRLKSGAFSIQQAISGALLYADY